jgi:hypothetical protein
MRPEFADKSIENGLKKGWITQNDIKVRVAGKEQLPVRNEVTKPGASSFIVNLERTGPVCERNGMEEHRTRGGANGMKRRRTFRAVNSSLTHSNNVDCNQFLNLFLFLIRFLSTFLGRLPRSVRSDKSLQPIDESHGDYPK